MGLSKSTRILILLAIDTAFFLLEIIVGYAVHSLALVADSFHMWQRAETLGALINSVFLIALCVSIALEAIQRFVEPQEVTQPKLILIVGSMGLASNIVGLFLFHDHGHSHGGHSHGDEVSAAEEGHATNEDGDVANESGNVADVMPQQRVAGWPKTNGKGKAISRGSSNEETAVEDASTTSRGHRRRKSGRSRSRAYSNFEDLPVNPSSFRKSIIEASKFEDIESEESTDVEGDHDGAVAEDGERSETPDQPLLKQSNGHGYGSIKKQKPIDHKQHKHRQPKDASKKGGHGHSHGDLNMRGVFLHVMGDALGNIGVIATALFIWLTKFSWRFYADPVISLVITIIILCSAIPLCKAASRILLNAVPNGIDVDDIKQDIEQLPGIVSCHHLHVWQLNDSKFVASLHVQVDFDFEGAGSARYMELAREIRQCLHEYRIHSSTIQPEFCLDPDHDHAAPADSEAHGHASSDHDHASAHATPGKGLSRQGSKAGSLKTDADACLLDCDDNCGGGKSCCAPPKTDKKDDEHDHSGHGHSH